MPNSCLKCLSFCEPAEGHRKRFTCVHPESPYQYEILKNPSVVPGDCPLRKGEEMQQDRESLSNKNKVTEGKS